MRFILVLLAVLGLLAGPAAAAGAQASCRDHGGAMMDMAASGGTAAHAMGAGRSDPCCDPAKAPGRHTHDLRTCLQACAAGCAAAAALPTAPAVPLASATQADPAPTRVASLKHRDPGRLERPPRSIA